MGMAQSDRVPATERRQIHLATCLPLFWPLLPLVLSTLQAAAMGLRFERPPLEDLFSHFRRAPAPPNLPA